MPIAIFYAARDIVLPLLGAVLFLAIFIKPAYSDANVQISQNSPDVEIQLTICMKTYATVFVVISRMFLSIESLSYEAAIKLDFLPVSNPQSLIRAN